MPTELLFRDNAYLTETPATIVAINERGGIELDRTVFYATGGGQPGDAGCSPRITNTASDGSRNLPCSIRSSSHRARDGGK